MKALAPGSEDKWREMCPEGHRGKTPCFPGTWLHGSEEGGGILSLIMDAYDTFPSLSIDSEETSGPLKGDLSLQCLVEEALEAPALLYWLQQERGKLGPT